MGKRASNPPPIGPRPPAPPAPPRRSAPVRNPEDGWRECHQALKECHVEIGQLREALRFYADNLNAGRSKVVLDDGGLIGRTALTKRHGSSENSGG